MNRSFRSQESQMQASAAAERQSEQLRAALMREKEDELALFLEMWKREKEQSNLLNNGEEFDAPLGSRSGSSSVFKISSTTSARKHGSDDFLNSDNDKNDYNWLLTPPGTPLFPSLEMESQKTLMSQIGTPTAHPTALKSRLANPQTELVSKGSTFSKQAASSPGLNSSIAGSRRPSSSGGSVSRSAVPSGRPTLSTTSKTSRSLTPTSRATLPSSRPTVSGTKGSAAASKPTASTAKPATSAVKPTSSATKPSVPARSSTPLSRSIARSSTPTSRPSIPPSKSTSRAATPTRRPSTQSSAPTTSAPPIKSSPSVTKPAPVTSSHPVPSRGSSPTMKPRPWKPSDMPGFSLEAPPI
ncbi:putative ATP binding protein [Tripterygium wilfordii]|uniref:Putative ATP binding protein n=1 Tax=Tripterygium wilfordii TaxID=458696 RepID=A0A7J7CWR7_TRIWF|nr:putative ATP binding protein [Tripterygium wilfordii]